MNHSKCLKCTRCLTQELKTFFWTLQNHEPGSLASFIHSNSLQSLTWAWRAERGKQLCRLLSWTQECPGWLWSSFSIPRSSSWNKISNVRWCLTVSSYSKAPDVWDLVCPRMTWYHHRASPVTPMTCYRHLTLKRSKWYSNDFFLFGKKLSWYAEKFVPWLLLLIMSFKVNHWIPFSIQSPRPHFSWEDHTRTGAFPGNVHFHNKMKSQF